MASAEIAPFVPTQHTGTVHALRAAAAHVELTVARALEPHGITAAQFELLQLISRNDAAGCSELGRQMAAPGPDITRMVDRLDTAGLVARSRDEKDRRVVHVVMTEKGSALLEQVRPVVCAAERQVFAGIPSEDQETLLRVLQQLRQACPGAADR
ncbi:MAG: MarR family transcriptional regulator [Gemmatimonadaceae bacterium]|nr:MarR family transcriptional regulator [Gemmatimonadaceae bacterium]